MKSDNSFKRNRIIFCYCIIYILFIINILFNIKSLYLWNDESFTFHMIHHSFSSIVNLTSQDVHPFLYYFIAKLGTSPFRSKFLQIRILRLISAIPYLILLIIGNSTIKHHFSNKIALLFMFSVITMPLLVQNIYQIRMYGWAMLFTTVAYIIFVYIDKNIIHNSFKTFCYISLFSLLASYTHYYALIIIFFIYILFGCLFITQHKNIKYLIISALTDTLFYIPWLKILLKQTKTVSNNYWTPLMNIKYVIKIILSLFNPDSNSNKKIFLIFSLLIILILSLVCFKKFNINLYSIYIGIIIPLIVIFIGVIASLFIKHTVLITRYLTPAMGIFWLSMSILINRFTIKHSTNQHIIKVILLVILLGLGSYSFNLSHVNEYGNQFNKTITIFKQIPKNSNIIFNESTVMYSSSSYLKRNYILGHRKNDVLFKIYKKVFNNIKNKQRLSINKSKPVYFIKLNKPNKNDIYLSSKTNQFMKKYKNRLIKKGNIYLPLDGGKSTVYRINN